MTDEEMEQFNVLQNEKCVLVKTEKLNDLKNRISFALKDGTLQQGFEIICKRIAELEKENKISEEIIIGEQQKINDLKKENEKIKEKYKEKFLKEIAEHNEAITELKKLLADEHEKFDKYLTETLELRAENEDLKAEIGLNEVTIQEQLKERVKVIKENEELKAQIEQMKCCGNCQSVFDADERRNKK